MLVSVVIVTYNSSATILETLNSIFLQTYKDIEVIISDDCSKDNTVSLVSDWLFCNQKRFSKVKVIESESNHGVTYNCNRGIEASIGEYVQLIAGDDLLMPNAIERKVEVAEKNKLNYIVCKTIPFGTNGQLVQVMEQFCSKGYEVLRQDRIRQLESILRDNFIAGPSGGFYRTKFFKDFGGYDERYPMIEDYPFIFHYLMAGNEIYFLEEELSQYRISDTSLCMALGSPMWKSLISFFEMEIRPEALKRGKLWIVVRFYLKCLKMQIKAWVKG